MRIEWMEPLWLLLVPVVLVYLYFTSKKGQSALSFSQKCALVLRSLVCFFLILAMTGPRISREADVTTTLFAVDRSASTERVQTAYRTFLAQAQEHRSQQDWAGEVVFGEKAGVEIVPSAQTVLGGGFFSYVNQDATNIAQALQLSVAALPEKTKKRIVLLSDGKETREDALAAAKQLAAAKIPVDVFSVKEEAVEEVQLSSLKLAEMIHRGTEYEIALKIDSTVDTESNVKLFKGRTLIADETVAISRGTNRIVFSDRTEEGGSLIYRAEIMPQTDTIIRNNKAYAFTYISDLPQVLLIAGEGGSAWSGLLESAGLVVTQVSPEAAPAQMQALSRFDGIILADVGMPQLPDGFLDALESYVKTIGGGLLVSGGEHAYALGEYYGTKLAEILPVDMELKTEGENPNLGMVMVIDHSGSMSSGNYGVTKMEMAKEAAMRSVERFRPEDSLGVVAFDQSPTWVAPLQQISEGKENILNGIGNIQPAGGTSILPALEEAQKELAKINTKQKHIILLTDGQAEQSGYELLLEDMRNSGITLSTIAVGGDSDTLLLERLAASGGGRYYFTNEFTDLPEIFLKETILAGKEYLNHRTFYPEQQDASPILAGIDAVPELSGYVGTTAKPRADMALVSDTGDPILASWQYGLGRTAVWTSDVGGIWSQPWLSGSEGPSVLQNALSWVMKKQPTEDVEITADPQGEATLLTVRMPYQKEMRSLAMQVVSADATEYTVPMQSDAPGVYTGTLPMAEEGAYVAALSLQKENGESEAMHTGFHIPYPKEYDIVSSGNKDSLLAQIASITGGRVLLDGASVFAGEVEKTTEMHALWPWVLGVALLLLLLDIAFRRMPALSQRLLQIWQSIEKQLKIRQESKPKKEPNPKVEKKAKKEVSASAKPVKEKKNVVPELDVSKNMAGQLLRSKQKRRK